MSGMVGVPFALPTLSANDLSQLECAGAIQSPFVLSATAAPELLPSNLDVFLPGSGFIHSGSVDSDSDLTSLSDSESSLTSLSDSRSEI